MNTKTVGEIALRPFWYQIFLDFKFVWKNWNPKSNPYETVKLSKLRTCWIRAKRIFHARRNACGYE